MSYVLELVFLRLGVINSYVWGNVSYVFKDSYVWGLVVCYVWGLRILTFGG